MSACISREGEYSAHLRDETYICERCGVLDEDGLIAELRELRDALAAAELRGAEQMKARLIEALRDEGAFNAWRQQRNLTDPDGLLPVSELWHPADYLESVSSGAKVASTSTTVCVIRVVYPDGQESVIGEWDPATRQYVLRPDAAMLRHWAASITEEGTDGR